MMCCVCQEAPPFISFFSFFCFSFGILMQHCVIDLALLLFFIP